jgi:hypothetical protein
LYFLSTPPRRAGFFNRERHEIHERVDDKTSAAVSYSGFTDDLPTNPTLDLSKEAGSVKALASEERVWVRTVV